MKKQPKIPSDWDHLQELLKRKSPAFTKLSFLRQRRPPISPAPDQLVAVANRFLTTNVVAERWCFQSASKRGRKKFPFLRFLSRDEVFLVPFQQDGGVPPFFFCRARRLLEISSPRRSTFDLWKLSYFRPTSLAFVLLTFRISKLLIFIFGCLGQSEKERKPPESIARAERTGNSAMTEVRRSGQEFWRRKFDISAVGAITRFEKCISKRIQKTSVNFFEGKSRK